MKIITRAVLDWDGNILEEDSYEYEGPVALAKDSGSAPQPVDPWQQAAAQYALSTGTAQFNAGLNRTNQTNPLGSSYWTTTPGNPGTGGTPTGIGGSGIPLSSSTPTQGVTPSGAGTSYSNLTGHDSPVVSNGTGGFGLGGGSLPGPTGSTAGTSYGTLATAPTYTLNTQLAPQFQSVLEKPIDTSGIAGMPGGPSTTQDLQNTQDALYRSQMQYLQPEEDLQKSQLQSQLANQGATIGSPAYNAEMARLGRQQEFQNSNARTQAITGAGAEQSRLFGLGSQSLQNQIAARNAPISEYNALSGAPGASATALTPDISGAFNQQYQGQLGAYNADVASANQTNGELASLAMMALLFSDKRLKEDIKRVGKTDGGLPVYTYRYKGDMRTQMGVMAQDVEKEMPEAVFGLGGRDNIKMVNYGAIK